MTSHPFNQGRGGIFRRNSRRVIGLLAGHRDGLTIMIRERETARYVTTKPSQHKATAIMSTVKTEPLYI